MVLMRAKFGTLAGMMCDRSRRIKYQSLIKALLYVPPISTRMRKITEMKRKAEVMSDHVLRVRVARLSCGLVRSGGVRVEGEDVEVLDFLRPKRATMVIVAAGEQQD